MVSGPFDTTPRVVDGAARLQVQKIAEYRNIKKSTNRTSPAYALDGG